MCTHTILFILVSTFASSFLEAAQIPRFFLCLLAHGSRP